MNRARSLRTALLLSLLAACVAASELDALDAEGSGFPAGKSDGGIDEGSPQALGVLALVNDSATTFEVLDGEVGLHATAAQNIIASRPFDTLAELDAVPYVGPIALDRLLAYATDHGYVESEPFQLPLEIHWARNSAEHRAAVAMAYAVATQRVEELSASGALPAAGWAVALDADETVLDNSLYQKERAEVGLGYSYASWTEWVARREAAPMPGAIAFMSRVKALGGTVAIVTNRKASECPDTITNLTTDGVPHDVVLCRTDVKDKAPRWAMVEDGTAAPGLAPAPIVMWVGDAIEDFPGLSQAVRFEADDAFAEFGRRFIVLPNPMYGSWTGNAQD